MKLKNNISAEDFAFLVADNYLGREYESSIGLGEVAIRWVGLMEEQIEKRSKITYRMANKALKSVDDDLSGAAFYALLQSVHEAWEYGDEIFAVYKRHYRPLEILFNIFAGASNRKNDA